MKPKTCFGFGMEPEAALHHFFAVIPLAREKKRPVQIYERFQWTGDEEAAAEKEAGGIVYANSQFLTPKDTLRLETPRHKWDMAVGTLSASFNSRLKADGKPTGKFAAGGVPLLRIFGMELMVLLWGIEDCDPSNIPTALKNWSGLRPEERWWLYMMTNAATGEIGDRRGWRTALRYALCENPIDDGGFQREQIRIPTMEDMDKAAAERPWTVRRVLNGHGAELH